MLKKIVVLVTLATTLTGCIVAPYDDHPNRHDGRYDQKRYDRDDKRADWHEKRSEWKKERETRPHWDRERSDRDRDDREHHRQR